MQKNLESKTGSTVCRGKISTIQSSRPTPRCQSLLSSLGRPGRVTTSTLPLTSITCFCNRSSQPSPVSQHRRAPGASDTAGGWMATHDQVSNYEFGRMNTIIGIILAKEMLSHLNGKTHATALESKHFTLCKSLFSICISELLLTRCHRSWTRSWRLLYVGRQT